MSGDAQVAERAAEQSAETGRNPHGSFIWYELITPDPDAAAQFYGDVVGWTSRSAGMDGMDYRLFSIDGTDVAGFMAPSPDAGEGLRPGWLGYIGVDDVDASVARITAAGGAVHMPAMDLEDVGRMAMVADPQGVAFYVMRGASEQPSRSFAPTTAGHCCWNELTTSDQRAALAFYTDQFGWTKGDSMPMGEMGDYQFIEHGGAMIGAVMKQSDGGSPPAWNFCFRVPNIDEAIAQVTRSGATITSGPVEVPGGDMVINAADPQGVAFMLLAPGKTQGDQ